MTNTIIGRVCIRKTDNKLIEFQSGQDKHSRRVLIENAIMAGYKEDEIEEKEITKDEYEYFQSLQPAPIKQVQKIKLKNVDTNTVSEYEVIESISIAAEAVIIP